MKKNQLIAISTDAKSIIREWPLKLKTADLSSLIRPTKTKTTKKNMNDQIVLWESNSNGGTVTSNLQYTGANPQIIHANIIDKIPEVEELKLIHLNKWITGTEKYV